MFQDAGYRWVLNTPGAVLANLHIVSYQQRIVDCSYVLC